ncbi:MAG: Xaa-Pro peptidase family protein [Planctomycetota bacterium]
MNFEKRRSRLRKRLKPIGASAFLITKMTNIRYLTGFTGSSAALFVGANHDVLLSDTRYETQLATECPDLEVEIRDSSSTMLDGLERITRQSKFASLGIEAAQMVKSTFDQLRTRLPQVDLISTEGEVESLRAIKDKYEIAAIRKSIAINQRSFEVIRAQLTAHQTEREIAHNLEHQMRQFGAAGVGFSPIVGVGARAALPHGVPGETKVGDAPFLLVDWGTSVDGYLSDLTRMIISGKTNAKFRKIYQTVLQAQLAAISAIGPGVALKEVDHAARKVITDAGFGKQFGHGTGHSFGLEIHELPYLSPIHEGTLKTGMVVTVEPGIYLPGIAGVRLEDDVLVTKNGYEVLSNLPKELEQCTVHLGG